jgi:hypothetical protein
MISCVAIFHLIFFLYETRQPATTPDKTGLLLQISKNPYIQSVV